eukprot:205460-Prorocentrum_lima.AAC.1
MTSSLVGSEMCIRDSPMTLDCRASVAPTPAHTPASMLAPAVAPTVAPTPVSYTHLTLPTICSV